MKVGNSFNVPQKTYIANDSTERDGINALFGDLCLVIEDGITYILNSEGEWYPYTIGGGGGGNANTDIIAPTYDPTLAYSQYQLIVYEGELYRAKEAIAQPAGDFDSTKWEKVDIASAKADLIDGKVPASQLPSYVDDVLEFDNRAAFPQEGERGIIYVAIDTGYTYRWAGNDYVAIGTLNTEVHIGASEPTGEEVIWIKPEGQNQSTATLDSKEVGDYIYLEETINNVTSTVPYRISQKNTATNKAILVRSYTDSLGFPFQENSLQVINNNFAQYQIDLMNIYNESVQNQANFYQTWTINDNWYALNHWFFDGLTSENENNIIIFNIGDYPLTSSAADLYCAYNRNNNEIFLGVHSESNFSIADNTFINYTKYLGAILEMDLDALLVDIDTATDQYTNYVLKFKKNGIWNDLNDLRIATRAELLTVEGNLRQSIETVADQLPFKLIFTPDEDYDGPELEEGQIPAKANYTFAEIHEALESGKEVHSYMSFPGSGLVFILPVETHTNSIFFQTPVIASENLDRFMAFNLEFKDNEIAIITITNKELPEGGGGGAIESSDMLEIINNNDLLDAVTITENGVTSYLGITEIGNDGISTNYILLM